MKRSTRIGGACCAFGRRFRREPLKEAIGTDGEALGSGGAEPSLDAGQASSLSAMKGGDALVTEALFALGRLAPWPLGRIVQCNQRG
jgi:hypothetical protein